MENIRRFKYNGEDSLVLPAHAEAFTTLSIWIEGIADELKIPFKTKNQLLIAVDEIFTNIASYGYPTSSGSATVVVEFDMIKEILTIIFYDTGVAYNPLEANPPDISISVDERPLGGLGIFLVRKLMDSVEYRRENDKNILILKKQVSGDL